jgi:ubiquinone/menaquinone biosynthesis C-methylase UbiE
MAAAYDTYDYPSYWEGRDYEHQSEVYALDSFLQKINRIDSLIEIGSGYGRLVPCYLYRAKRIVLTDPSAKLLKIARENYSSNNKIEFIQSSLENLSNKTRNKSYNLAILIRVLHHIKDVDSAFKTIYKLLKNRGYFILEFPNKCHSKAAVKEFIKGNFIYSLDIFPQDKRSKKSIKEKTLPFLNYHPEVIKTKLEDTGFNIIDIRSVSNIRSTNLKKIFPTSTLISIERRLQKPLASISFGPSIFILCQKTT